MNREQPPEEFARWKLIAAVALACTATTLVAAASFDRHPRHARVETTSASSGAEEVGAGSHPERAETSGPTPPLSSPAEPSPQSTREAEHAPASPSGSMMTPAPRLGSSAITPDRNGTGPFLGQTPPRATSEAGAMTLGVAPFIPPLAPAEEAAPAPTPAEGEIAATAKPPEQSTPPVVAFVPVPIIVPMGGPAGGMPGTQASGGTPAGLPPATPMGGSPASTMAGGGATWGRGVVPGPMQGGMPLAGVGGGLGGMAPAPSLPLSAPASPMGLSSMGSPGPLGPASMVW